MRFLYLVVLLILYSASSAFGQEPIKSLSCEPVRTEAFFGTSPNDWILYLKRNVDINIPAAHCAPAGKYYVEVIFRIGKTGKIEQVRSISSAGFGMEEELIRAITSSPSWKPATQNGRVHRSYRCETFVFEISNPTLL